MTNEELFDEIVALLESSVDSYIQEYKFATTPEEENDFSIRSETTAGLVGLLRDSFTFDEDGSVIQ